VPKQLGLMNRVRAFPKHHLAPQQQATFASINPSGSLAAEPFQTRVKITSTATNYSCDEASRKWLLRDLIDQVIGGISKK